MSLVLLAGILIFSARPGVAFDEPAGINKARFGMTPAELLKVYPQAKMLPHPTPAQHQALALESYQLTGQKIGRLKDCRLEMRFFGGHLELYEIQALCPDKDEVTRYLTGTFGMPTRTTDSMLMWTGSKVAINYVPKSGAFSFGDIARARDMQAMLMQALRGMNLGRATPTPAQ
ncbi:MAG: hypothetical protein HY270_06725 [Deltaproteobacteria bacterium]|nr:hypothetical protein [Deltaproteobacteria bacterium]